MGLPASPPGEHTSCMALFVKSESRGSHPIQREHVIHFYGMPFFALFDFALSFLQRLAAFKLINIRRSGLGGGVEVLLTCQTKDSRQSFTRLNFQPLDLQDQIGKANVLVDELLNRLFNRIQISLNHVLLEPVGGDPLSWVSEISNGATKRVERIVLFVDEFVSVCQLQRFVARLVIMNDDLVVRQESVDGVNRGIKYRSYDPVVIFRFDRRSKLPIVLPLLNVILSG
jgi:hypothetical protein